MSINFGEVCEFCISFYTSIYCKIWINVQVQHRKYYSVRHCMLLIYVQDSTHYHLDEPLLYSSGSFSSIQMPSTSSKNRNTLRYAFTSILGYVVCRSFAEFPTLWLSDNSWELSQFGSQIPQLEKQSRAIRLPLLFKRKPALSILFVQYCGNSMVPRRKLLGNSFCLMSGIIPTSTLWC